MNDLTSWQQPKYIRDVTNVQAVDTDHGHDRQWPLCQRQALGAADQDGGRHLRGVLHSGEGRGGEGLGEEGVDSEVCREITRDRRVNCRYPSWTDTRKTSRLCIRWASWLVSVSPATLCSALWCRPWPRCWSSASRTSPPGGSWLRRRRKKWRNKIRNNSQQQASSATAGYSYNFQHCDGDSSGFLEEILRQFRIPPVINKTELWRVDKSQVEPVNYFYGNFLRIFLRGQRSHPCTDIKLLPVSCQSPALIFSKCCNNIPLFLFIPRTAVYSTEEVYS